MTEEQPPKRERGRPALGVRRVQVSLDQLTIERLTALGDGNLSAGIRIAAQTAKFTPVSR